MLYSELIAEIKFEAKLEDDPSWDAHLLLLIWDEEIQIATLQNEASLYISRQPLTSADQNAGTKLVTIPPMIKLDRMEYYTPSSGGAEWILPDRNQVVPPVPQQGKPRSYEILQGVPPSFLLTFNPPFLLQADILYVSYWKYPAVPAGVDTIFPSTWIPSLKVNCVRRAQIFNSSDVAQRAAAFGQILLKAEAVSLASNQSLDIVENEKTAA